jgi:carbon-monoxide dehydrogenase small subunit
VDSRIRVTINGEPYDLQIDPRETLIDVIRDRARLTGPHVGCRTASCGACTISLDGLTVKSCCVPAGDADGRSVSTIEDAEEPQQLDDIQRAFSEVQGMQCGFCTPGMIMSVRQLLRTNPDPDDEQIKVGIAGNICRCTGYVNILKAVRAVRDARLDRQATEPP